MIRDKKSSNEAVKKEILNELCTNNEINCIQKEKRTIIEKK